MMLKLIETAYKGYRFRSRLEARWAVFFDELKVKYQYEPQGFDLNGILYLPDFWLPDQQCWIEIKPNRPDNDTETKATRLADLSGKRVLIFFDECWYPWELEDGGAYCHFPGSGWDNSYRWCVCTTCGRTDIQYDGRSDRLPCKEKYWRNQLDRPVDGASIPAGCPVSPHGDKGYTFDHPRILAAYQAARSARFEHGETPR